MNPMFGATVGRVASRINNGRFELDSKSVQLPRNEGNKHHLHGGFRGFSHKFWSSRSIPDGVEFSLHSPDGDQGYPGSIITTVSYTLVQNDAAGANKADLKI